jgi:Tfp pilus assembly protein PilV
MSIKKNQTGFILIDSLFAVTVTTVALFSLIGLVTMGTRAYLLNTEQSRAYQVAASYGDGMQSVTITDWRTTVQASSYQTIDVNNNAGFSTYLANARNNRDAFKTAFADAADVSVAVSARLSDAADISNRLAQVRIVVSWNQGQKNVQLIKYYVRNTDQAI